MRTLQKSLIKRNTSLSFDNDIPEQYCSHIAKSTNNNFKANGYLKSPCTKFRISKEPQKQSDNNVTEDINKQIEPRVSLMDFTEFQQANDGELMSFLSRTVSDNSCSNTVYQLNEDLECIFESKSVASNSTYAVNLAFNI